MKVLKRKLKKVHIVKRIFYNLTLILYIACFAYFIYGLLHLPNIETALRIIVIAFFGIWLLIYILCGLLSMLAKKTKTFVFLTFISLLLCPIFAGSSYLINKTYGSLNNMVHEQLTYTTNLIALNETNFDSSMTIGMIEQEDDIEGNILAKKLIEKEKLQNKIQTYEDYHSMLMDLLNGKIGACFVTSNYAITFSDDELSDEDNQVSLSKSVKVLYEYSEDRENQDIVTLKTSKTKTLTEPFTVLVMGVDSAQNGLKANQAFNGDTLILVTFNPNTLTATMFSIPRDLYVPIACNHDRYAKINSSAAYGSSCVISTVQKLTGIDIDYYVKINFTGVVDLVNALDGVDVDVEEPDFWYDDAHVGQLCESNQYRQTDSASIVCMGLGEQHLDGAQALAYARCRHLFATSDIARNQHQQQIIEAMAKKLKTINSISEFNKILDAVSNNIETNMTPEQILSFYNVGKDMLMNSSTNALSIKRTYLSYYSLPVWQSRYGRYTSALGYWPNSLDAITKLMRVNLGLESETPVKTFSFSYNEDYSTPLVGYGISGGAKLERMETFIGYDQTTASNYCLNHNITCSFEYTLSAEPYGIIVDQDVHEGVLMKTVSEVTFYLSNGEGKTEPTTPTNNCPTNQEIGADGVSCVCMSGYSRLTPTDPCEKTEEKPSDDPNNSGEGGGETPTPSNPEPTEPTVPTEDTGHTQPEIPGMP